MEKFVLLGFVFLAISLAGLYLAYLYGRKTKKFRWSEYIAIIIWPFLFVLTLVYYIDAKILILFIVSCFAGSILEYILGFAYHKTLNKKLWVYKHLSLNGYTSLLSIPIWGMTGVIFWFLGKLVGL